MRPFEFGINEIDDERNLDEARKIILWQKLGFPAPSWSDLLWAGQIFHAELDRLSDSCDECGLEKTECRGHN